MLVGRAWIFHARPTGVADGTKFERTFSRDGWSDPYGIDDDARDGLCTRRGKRHIRDRTCTNLCTRGIRAGAEYNPLTRHVVAA